MALTAGGRTGVMGGTFDPVHAGHLAAATAAANALGLEAVVFIPSHHPPHRASAPRVSAYQRFALVALAVAADPRFAVSDIEMCRSGPSFTADTLRRLHDLGHSASRLFFILGSDAFAEIATWHDYPDVLDLASFAVVSRPGCPLGALAERVPELAPRLAPAPAAAGAASEGPKPGRIFLVEAPTPDVSSTAIRERLASGAGAGGMLPAPVEAHIRRHGLYLPDPLSPGWQLA